MVMFTAFTCNKLVGDAAHVNVLPPHGATHDLQHTAHTGTTAATAAAATKVKVEDAAAASLYYNHAAAAAAAAAARMTPPPPPPHYWQTGASYHMETTCGGGGGGGGAAYWPSYHYHHHQHQTNAYYQACQAPTSPYVITDPGYEYNAQQQHQHYSYQSAYSPPSLTPPHPHVPVPGVGVGGGEGVSMVSGSSTSGSLSPPSVTCLYSPAAVDAATPVPATAAATATGTSCVSDVTDVPDSACTGGAAAAAAAMFDWMRKPAYPSQPLPGKTRTRDKYRVVYNDHQRLELEKEFLLSRYITIKRKAELSRLIHLSERQIKIWFQNRRAKDRKLSKKRRDAACLSSSAAAAAGARGGSGGGSLLKMDAHGMSAAAGYLSSHSHHIIPSSPPTLYR